MMAKEMTNRQLVEDFEQARGIYTEGVPEEICRRAGMSKDWDEATGETFERVTQTAVETLKEYTNLDSFDVVED